MPEIPVYHSQGTPPETSRLPMANPGIVGGEEILQGTQRLQNSLLHAFQVQQQQAQADQITDAGRIYGNVLQSLSAKSQALLEGQRTNPRNPMELSREYTAYAKELYQSTLDAPEIQESPYLKKYLATHLATAVNGSIAKEVQSHNEMWGRWDRIKSAETVEQWRDVVRQDPEQLKQARAWFAGKVLTGTYTDVEAQTAFDKLKGAVNYDRGMSFATANAEGWVRARFKGQYPEGFDPLQYSTEELDKFTSAANDTFTRQTTMQNEVDKKQELALTHQLDDTKQEWISRAIQVNPSTGDRLYSTKSILYTLSTKEARAELGNQYDTVVQFYNALDHHEKTAGKTDPAKYTEYLTRIYRGEFTTPLSVIQAASDHVDSDTMTKLLSVFNAERGHADTWNTQRFNEADGLIAQTFHVPQGSSIDPLPFQNALVAARSRYLLFYERLKDRAVKEGNPSILSSADLIGEARRVADEGYLALADSLVQVQHMTETSLQYKTPNDAASAFESGQITKRQYDNALRDIDKLQALDAAIQKRKAGSAEYKPNK